MKLDVNKGYESEIKKSNKAFIIIQNYSTSCFIISAFWRILIGNGGEQDIINLVIMAWPFQYRYACKWNQKF